MKWINLALSIVFLGLLALAFQQSRSQIRKLETELALAKEDIRWAKSNAEFASVEVPTLGSSLRSLEKDFNSVSRTIDLVSDAAIQQKKTNSGFSAAIGEIRMDLLEMNRKIDRLWEIRYR